MNIEPIPAAGLEQHVLSVCAGAPITECLVLRIESMLHAIKTRIRARKTDLTRDEVRALFLLFCFRSSCFSTNLPTKNARTYSQNVAG